MLTRLDLEAIRATLRNELESIPSRALLGLTVYSMFEAVLEEAYALLPLAQEKSSIARDTH
ncbi:hypothetical protein [Anaplasma phagocytophilum]|uniref:hypothetical protein n=1 Tax=Anaplasma phagocytophilum TaxID=948 RepID=UPI00201AFC94